MEEEEGEKIYRQLLMEVKRIDRNKSLAVTTLFPQITSWRELKELSTDLNKKFANLFSYPKLITL